MEWICCALIFFPVVFLAKKFWGPVGEKAAIAILIIGSFMLILSLPLACYVFLRFVIPVL